MADTEHHIADILTDIRHLVDADTAQIIEYIHTENAILREMLGTKRPRFTKQQRRRLVKAGMPIKDRLHEFATLVQPETILRWYRRLKQKKWDYSERRGKTVGARAISGSDVQNRCGRQFSPDGTHLSDQRLFLHAAAPCGSRSLRLHRFAETDGQP